MKEKVIEYCKKNSEKVLVLFLLVVFCALCVRIYHKKTQDDIKKYIDNEVSYRLKKELKNELSEELTDEIENDVKSDLDQMKDDLESDLESLVEEKIEEYYEDRKYY